MIIMIKAQLIDISHPNHHQKMAEIILNGGVVGAIWGHHLYFLACNALNSKAVGRLNQLKGRPKSQVLVSPGAVEEAEEFADISKCKGLLYASKKMGMKPLKYLEFLFRKFPLGVELFANDSTPSSVTSATSKGKTIWIAAHMGDRSYLKLLNAVRILRKGGQKVIFAGTSLNLKGDNTLTVKDFDKIMTNFADKIDALSVHPQGGKLKKLKFSTSCSVVSFIHQRPQLLRFGATSLLTLKKYIPDLEIAQTVLTTRR